MAQLQSLTVRVDFAAPALSFLSVAAVVVTLGDASESCARLSDEFAMAGDDTGNLFVAKPVLNPAGGALVAEGVKVHPSDRYLELVAAIANEAKARVVFSDHGWPILSVGEGSPTVTEGEVAAKRLPGGAT